jgi:ActR/RegA family two-component response regulator
VTETVLIVDDEEPVRRTFREWLEGANLDIQVRVAADAEAALLEANRGAVDLAVLDWNLGAGNDGLQLLEDLYVFNPEVVAIMVTGFAHQATPLDAMRMGVRDYLDKNQDLNRAAFLAAVRRQLDIIRPAKRERQLHRSLAAFREAVDQVLPLVQSAAVLNDPVPLPRAVGSLFRFLLQTTNAEDGALLVRSYDAGRTPAEACRAYGADGATLAVELAPFARSLAGAVVSRQEPCVMDLSGPASASFELQPFERGRRSVLAAALAVAPGVHAVLELFDKQGPAEFTAADRALAAAAADFGVELLRQALAERQSQRVLFDALGAAREATAAAVASLHSGPATGDPQPPAAVLECLREGLRAAPDAAAPADDTLRLVEAVRVLARRHGAPAVRHCTRMVEEVRRLLDETVNEER